MRSPGGAPTRKCCGNHTYAPHDPKCPVGLAEKMGIEVHYLAEEARGPEHDGEFALCDLRAHRDAPRDKTLASAARNEVTCAECLNHLTAP